VTTVKYTDIDIDTDTDTVADADADVDVDVDVRTLLAYEVHDRIGSGLALVLRRLDFFERTGTDLAPAERARLQDVRTALLETLGTTRDLVSGLRRPATVPAQSTSALAALTASVQAASLEVSLRGFLRAVAPFGADVRLRVYGENTPAADHHRQHGRPSGPGSPVTRTRRRRIRAQERRLAGPGRIGVSLLLPGDT
jgi:hypothetical protein